MWNPQLYNLLCKFALKVHLRFLSRTRATPVRRGKGGTLFYYLTKDYTFHCLVLILKWLVRSRYLSYVNNKFFTLQTYDWMGLMLPKYQLASCSIRHRTLISCTITLTTRFFNFVSCIIIFSVDSIFSSR